MEGYINKFVNIDEGSTKFVNIDGGSVKFVSSAKWLLIKK